MEENTIELVMYVTWKDKIIKASDLIKQLLIEIEEKNKEIERLNNIINELEKYANSLWLDDKGIVLRFRDKLQELKGSDKE